jgi:hypothetical protein
MAETRDKRQFAGFDALIKGLDKCINVGGGSVEKQRFFPFSNIPCFYVSYPFVSCLLSLSLLTVTSLSL